MIYCSPTSYHKVLDGNYMYIVKESQVCGRIVTTCTYLTRRLLTFDEIVYMRENYRDLIPLSFNMVTRRLPEHLDGVVLCLMY